MGVLASLAVITLVLPLPPLAAVLDRLTVLILPLLALPTLRLRRLILAGRRCHGVWRRAAAGASLLVPAVFAVATLTGLLGYVNPAWAVAAHLGWLALVVAAWALAHALLGEAVAGAAARLRGREDADFWEQNVVGPLHRLGNLGLLLVAGAVLVELYGWDRDTLVVGWVPRTLDTTLFTVAGARIKGANFSLAAAMAVAVFWVGDWGRRVSDRWAFARITDPGVRNSLATFTQYVIVVVGLLTALRTVGLNLTALSVFAGALG